MNYFPNDHEQITPEDLKNVPFFTLFGNFQILFNPFLAHGDESSIIYTIYFLQLEPGQILQL